MTQPTRRRFLRNTLGLVAAGVAAGAGGYYATRDRINLGLIGAGIRAHDLARIINLCSYYYYRYGTVVAICDVDRPRAETVRDAWCSGALIYTDYRELLQQSNVDAVIIATPDHWHVPMAKAALNAGKPVYLEKPISLAINEGKELLQLEAKTKLPVLVGTQQRIETRFRAACELVRAGRLGKVQRVEITLPLKQPEPLAAQAEALPAGLDWDRWLGPAPSVPFSTARFKAWRSWWDYGGGEIANMGAHHIDIAQWALGLDNTGPTNIKGTAEPLAKPGDLRVPAQFTVEMAYENGVQVILRSDAQLGTGGGGILFEGEAGKLFVDRARFEGTAVDELKSKPLPSNARLHLSVTNTPRDTRQQLCHFLDCIRREINPVSDLNSAHRTATACHLANLALRLNRPLHWEPKTETFVNDAQASTYLNRTYRPGWVS